MGVCFAIKTLFQDAPAAVLIGLFFAIPNSGGQSG